MSDAQKRTILACRASRRCGMTALEVAIASSLFVMIFVGTWRLFTETASAMEFALTGSSVGTSTRRAMDRMVEEIHRSGLAASEPPVLTICHNGVTRTLNETVALNHLSEHPGDTLGPCNTGDSDPTTFTDYVLSHPSFETTTAPAFTFQIRTGFAGDATDWSTPITFGLAPSPGEIPGDGTDNDGDGQTDEQQLVRTQNGVTDALADGVMGLTFTRDQGENSIQLTLTLARTSGSSEYLSHILTTRVGMRNLAR